jgi:hypothetical protein
MAVFSSSGSDVLHPSTMATESDSLGEDVPGSASGCAESGRFETNLIITNHGHIDPRPVAARAPREVGYDVHLERKMTQRTIIDVDNALECFLRFNPEPEPEPEPEPDESSASDEAAEDWRAMAIAPG